MLDHGYDYARSITEYKDALDWFKEAPGVNSDDVTYYQQYYDHAVAEFAAVGDDEQQILAKWNKAGWQKFTLRHGVASIVGEMCEMIAIWYYIKQGYVVTRCTEKEDQVLGRDLWISKSKYNGQRYSVSVKARKLYAATRMVLREDDFKATADQLNRIMFVMFDHKLMFQCSYPNILQYYSTTPTKRDGSMEINKIDFRTFAHSAQEAIPL